jgi:hypothetical protein
MIQYISNIISLAGTLPPASNRWICIPFKNPLKVIKTLLNPIQIPIGSHLNTY